MKNNVIKKILSAVIAVVVLFSTVNINIVYADELTPVEEKYAAITGLYKTVDETIELLIKRADNDEIGERTYFVKSKEETLDTSWWDNIVDRRSGENIYLAFRNNDCVYTFKLGDYYYHTLRIDTYRAYTTSEDKKEYEEKVKYVEETLGLFSEEMCDYEKAAIIFKYVVDNVEYGGYGTSNYKGQTAYEALMKKEAVCGGYSRLYSSMLTDMNINNIWITSRELEVSHAWNLVEMGDKWYYCDPTYSTRVLPINEFVYLPSFLRGSIEDSKAPQHEVDKFSYNTINYYSCNVSEETMRFGDDGKGSSRVSLARIYNYTAPTCTETGYYDIGCDYCNDRHEITIPATHYYTYTTTKEATCNEDGSGVATCTLCEDSYEYIIPKKEHKWNYAHQEADCETDGYEKVYCEECEANYWIEETKAYVHDWSDWFEASLTQYAKECSKCGDKVYELKSTIDGHEPTKEYIPEEDLEAKDRGCGIIGYFDIKSKCWVYIHPIYNDLAATYPNCMVELPNGEFVYWNDETHTFYKKEGNSEKTSVSPEVDQSTSNSDDNLDDFETNTPPFASNNDNETPTTVNEKDTTTTLEPTTVAPTTKTVTPPAKAKVKSASKKKAAKKVKVSIKNVKGTSGYKVQFSTTKKFKKTLVTKTVKKATTTISNIKLKNKKNLYVRVKAYKLNGKKKVWAKKWSKVKKVIIKI